MSLVLLLGFILLQGWVQANIIAYDCADPEAEVSRVSLLEVRPCHDPKNSSTEENRRIQLVQERQYTEVHVFTCLVTVRQLTEHCGMHSHTSAVAGGLSHYVHYLKSEACVNAHRSRLVDLTGMGAGIISGLQLNGTTEASVTLVGYLEPTGKCDGARYTVNGVTYEDVVVSAAITIKLHDYLVVANVEENTLKLPTGTVCQYAERYCFDDLAGEITWEVDSIDQCAAQGIDVLYEGTASLLTINHTNTMYVIIEARDTVFALRLTQAELLCHQPAWRTEQNRLIVIFETSLGFYYRKTRRIAQNTDLMAHVLSKLLFLEIAFKQHTRELVYDAILKRCRLRENILRNRLALARESPDIVSDLVKEAAGHMGRVLGEVLYIVRCTAKVVDFRRTEFCYQELPISYQNQSKFMAPISRIIQDYGSQVECERKLPVMFHLEGQWLEIDPELRKAHPAPTILDANDEAEIIPSMKVAPISAHGIYTREDMEAFQSTLLFPNERRAVTNLVTRRVTGANVDAQGYHLPNVFSQDELMGMVTGVVEKTWGILSRLGNVFSVVMMVSAIWSFLTWIIASILNFFNLKKVAPNIPRTPFFLLSSLWGVLANRLLINLLAKQPTADTDPADLEAGSSPAAYPRIASLPGPVGTTHGLSYTHINQPT